MVSVRPKLVVGNWKMNGDTAQMQALLPSLVSGLANLLSASPKAITVAVCPSFPFLGLGKILLGSSPIALGAQNIAMAKSGAFTGEVSASMLADLHCRYVILGHSERRALYGETDAVVAEKIERALEAGLEPIVCVGETLGERESGRFAEVIAQQLSAALKVLPKTAMFVLAYEPVWAIGTGKTASPEQAQEVHALIRAQLSASGFDAQSVPILYGGSVKSNNAASLFSQPDIDGGLIGGAALVAEEFIAICSALQ